VNTRCFELCSCVRLNS